MIPIRTRNAAEIQVFQGLRGAGYTVLKNGWPDFLAFDTYGRVRFIEVKPTCRARLSHRQQRMADVLRTIGIDVELIVGKCVCGKCAPALAREEVAPFHDGQHADCLVCEPLKKPAA